MADFDFSRTVPFASVNMMGFMLIALPVLQILVYLFIRRNYPGAYRGVFLGMASNFLICDCILSLVYLGEHYLGETLLAGQTNEALITSSKNIGQVLSLIIECFILVNFMEFSYRHFSYQAGISKLGNALSFALGFSLVDTLKLVASVFTNWIMAVSINQMGLSEFAGKLNDEELKAFMNDIEPLLTHGVFYYFSLFVERIIFAAFIFAIVVMMQLVTKKLLSRQFLIKLTGIYLLYYLPGLLKNFGLIKGRAMTVICMLLITVFVNLMSWQVVKKTDPEDTEYLSQIWQGGLFKAIFGTMKNKNEKKNKPGSITRNANTK